MDDSVRELERALAEEFTIDKFVKFLRELVRAGRGDEVPGRVLGRPGLRVDALGALSLGHFGALTAWRLPEELGGHVLLLARASGTARAIAIAVRPGDRFHVEYSYMGNGEHSESGSSASHFAENGRETRVADVKGEEPRFEAFFKTIADASGATLTTKTSAIIID